MSEIFTQSKDLFQYPPKNDTIARNASQMSNILTIMTKILFDRTRLSVSDMEQCKELIQKILNRQIRYPDVKQLEGIKYQGQKVYRARINKKDRLFFTFVTVKDDNQPLLMVLNINDHNYEAVYRQLKHGHDIKSAEYQISADEIDPLKQNSSHNEENKELTWLGVASYNEKLLHFDTNQELGMTKNTPLILQGPPGTGKTAVLISRIKKELATQPTSQRVVKPNSTNPDTPSFAENIVITQSPYLVKTLKNDYEAEFRHHDHPVDFKTWIDFSQSLNQGLRPASSEQFAQWLKKYHTEDPADIIHDELSLIAALGSELYLKQKKRQCYFPEQLQKQTKLIKLLESWNNYLSDQSLFDPKVTVMRIPDLVFNKAYLDEAQNSPPVALRFFIEHTPKQGIMVCLDDEQAMISSPFTHSCIKQLFNKYYGIYFKQQLPRTWRCPPAVVKVANTLLATKHQLDMTGKRRAYNNIESANSKAGAVSLIDTQTLNQLKPYGAEAGTVVISDYITPEESKSINQKLNSANILNTRVAIGLDFKIVILWKPFSENKCLRELRQAMKKTASPGLTLEQWKALNALYVAISRTEYYLFIYEPDSYWWEMCELFFGPLPRNIAKIDFEMTHTPEQEREEWIKRVKHHLGQGQTTIARNLMAFHLQMNEQQIEAFIAEQTPAEQIKPEQKPMPKPEYEPVKKTVPTTSTLVKKSAGTKNRQAPEPAPIPAAKKAASAKAEKDAFIKTLLSNITQKNLTAMLKIKQPLKFLFTYPYQGDAVFTWLLEKGVTSVPLNGPTHPRWIKKENEDLRCLFVSMLGFTDLFKFFTTEYLNKPTTLHPNVTPLFLLSPYTIVGDFLSDCCEADDNFTKGITYEALCATSLIVGPDGKVRPTESAFFYFARTQSGQRFLEQLLERNPVVFSQITPEFLSQQRTKNDYEIYGNSVPHSSILFLLVLCEEGRRILNKLVVLNPQLAATLDCSVIASGLLHEGSNKILLSTVSTGTGRRLINNLLDCNIDFANHVTTSALCHLQVNSRDSLNTTPLYFLLSYPEGHRILKKLLEMKPNLLDLATPILMRYFAEGQRLNWLCHTFDGIGVLLHLFSRNKELVNEISAEQLFHCYVIGQNGHMSCAFNSLMAIPSGFVVLIQFINANPEIAKRAFSSLLNIWLNQRDVTDMLQGFPNLKALSASCFGGTPEGKMLLRFLFKEHQEIVRSITSRILETEEAAQNIASIILSIMRDDNGFMLLGIIKAFMPDIFSYIEHSIPADYSVKFKEDLIQAEYIGKVIEAEIADEYNINNETNSLMLTSGRFNFFNNFQSAEQNNSSDSDDEYLNTI